MRRRDFVALIGGSFFIRPLSAMAQDAGWARRQDHRITERLACQSTMVVNPDRPPRNSKRGHEPVGPSTGNRDASRAACVLLLRFKRSRIADTCSLMVFGER